MPDLAFVEATPRSRYVCLGLIASIVTPLGFCGCGGPTVVGTVRAQPDAKWSHVRDCLNEFEYDFRCIVDKAAQDIEAQDLEDWVKESARRKRVLLWKRYMYPLIRSAATEKHPDQALVHCWAQSLRMQHYLDRSALKEAQATVDHPSREPTSQEGRGGERFRKAEDADSAGPVFGHTAFEDRQDVAVKAAGRIVQKIEAIARQVLRDEGGSSGTTKPGTPEGVQTAGEGTGDKTGTKKGDSGETDFAKARKLIVEWALRNPIRGEFDRTLCTRPPKGNDAKPLTVTEWLGLPEATDDFVEKASMVIESVPTEMELQLIDLKKRVLSGSDEGTTGRLARGASGLKSRDTRLIPATEEIQAVAVATSQAAKAVSEAAKSFKELVSTWQSTGGSAGLEGADDSGLLPVLRATETMAKSVHEAADAVGGLTVPKTAALFTAIALPVGIVWTLAVIACRKTRDWRVQRAETQRERSARIREHRPLPVVHTASHLKDPVLHHVRKRH
ncbi:MAG: hypothetical protein JXQ73_29585 [Phycisphaerae bacterium]|nr:hypothetical protein [Phycisphaerae bacterium]